MIRDILCDSDCVYQENELCEKQNDITMSFLNGSNMEPTLSDMVICGDYMARKVESKLDRIVSVCHNEAVVIRGDNEGTNHYECVKCSQPCDIKQQEVTE